MTDHVNQGHGCVDIPPIDAIKGFLEFAEQALQEDYEGVCEVFAIDSFEEAEQNPDTIAHLTPEDQGHLRTSVSNWRTRSRTYDWLVHFLNRDTDVLDPALRTPEEDKAWYDAKPTPDTEDPSFPPILQMEVDRG
jgi:hypothetical protein